MKVYVNKYLSANNQSCIFNGAQKEVSENANDAIENDEDWNESDLYQ